MAEEKREAKSSEKEEDFDRITPQNVYDQSETFQVGGTVVNRNLNRKEYEVETAEPEKHNFNELDEDNDAFDQEKYDQVAETEDNMVTKRRRRAKKSAG
jgi:hypothetical protein